MKQEEKATNNKEQNKQQKKEKRTKTLFIIWVSLMGIFCIAGLIYGATVGKTNKIKREEQYNELLNQYEQALQENAETSMVENNIIK